MRAIKVAIAAVLLAVGGVVVFWRIGVPGGARPTPAATPSLTLAEVTRTDLSDSRLLPGTLDFGAGVQVRGSGDGIVTQLPAVGTTVRRGKPLFRVDDQPVAVLFGDTPLFRPLDKPGLIGRDVAELRENLALLGYASMRVRDRDVLDAGLLAAARRWQHDLDLPSPGAVTPARAVVLDRPGRVSAVTGRLGDPPATDLLTVTGTARVVSVPVDATDAGSFQAGANVSISLPSGKSTPGVVRSIGTVVTAGDPGESPKITVIVRPARPADVAKVDAAAVQVRFTTAARKKVLTVPVGALIALREGGYALQLRAGSLVPAKTGMFAGGLVEVSGPQVTEGLDVVTTP